MISTDAADALERFGDPDLLAAGKVNLISLEAVQARFGRRWAFRCEQVYDFTLRVLERGVGAHGFFLRVSDTDFFIVHPELGDMAAQAACLRYLREVLNHFLGQDRMALAGVLQVTRITRDGLEARPMAEPGLQDMEHDPAAPRGGQAVSSRWSVDHWTPFVAADGRLLHVSAALEPVYELKTFTPIGFRMVRRVSVVRNDGEETELAPHAVAMLSTADLLRVDLATIARGVERLRSGGREELSLIVPLSFASLCSQKGRAEFVKQLKGAGSLVKLGVISEVCDIEGAPVAALLAAAALVRPFSLLVAGRLTSSAAPVIAGLDGAGLQALSLECPPGLGDAEFTAWASAAITAAKRVVKSVLVYRATSPARIGVLASLGATHASLVMAEIQPP